MKKPNVLIVIGVIAFIGFVLIIFNQQSFIDRPASQNETSSQPVSGLSAPQTIEELTAPDSVIPVSNNSDSKLRIFNIKINSSGFSPAKIVVNQNDIVQFNLTALDGSYDFFLSFPEYHTDVPLNKAREFSFEALRSGRFIFSCRDKCPAGVTVSGELIVLEKH